jgi:hypothetical protein
MPIDESTNTISGFPSTISTEQLSITSIESTTIEITTKDISAELSPEMTVGNIPEITTQGDNVAIIAGSVSAVIGACLIAAAIGIFFYCKKKKAIKRYTLANKNLQVQNLLFSLYKLYCIIYTA